MRMIEGINTRKLGQVAKLLSTRIEERFPQGETGLKDHAADTIALIQIAEKGTLTFF